MARRLMSASIFFTPGVKRGKKVFKEFTMYVRKSIFALITICLLHVPSAEAGPSDVDLLLLTNYELEQTYEAFVKEVAFGLYFNPGNSGSPMKQASKPVKSRGRKRVRNSRGSVKSSSVNGIKISVEAGTLMPSSATSDLFTTSGGGEIASTPITKLKFQVGLPEGVDLGYNFSYLGNFISSSGLEVRYDIGQYVNIKGFSFAGRVHYSTAIVTTELDIYTAGVDFIAGLSLGNVEPYLSLGTLSIRGSPSKALTDKNPVYVTDELITGMPITVGVKAVPVRSFSTFAEIGIFGDAKTISVGFGLDF